MQRRTLLKLGLASAATLAIAGGGLAMLQPGWRDGRMTTSARELFAAVARAVLDGSLPVSGPAQEAALMAHLDRLDTAIAGLPNAVRQEVSQLVAVLNSAIGRRALAGLATPWPQASVAEVQAALQHMRRSSLALRRQVYQGLRELTNAAYFADPATWAALGYPGPRALT